MRRGGEGLEPFDRKVPRSALPRVRRGGVRAQVMLDRGYTPTAGTTAQLTGGECAAVLLALLLQTEASVPPANASAAGRAVDPGREQRRRAATAALRDQAERLRAAGARLGKAWAKAWPPSCAAPVRSLLSESPGLCSPLVELRAARARRDRGEAHPFSHKEARRQYHDRRLGGSVGRLPA